MTEVNQPRKEASPPVVTTTILVMPDPLSIQGLVHSHSSEDADARPLEVAPVSSNLCDSPDDILAEAYPTIGRHAQLSIRDRIIEFAHEIAEGFLDAGELGPAGERVEDSTVRVTFSHRRAREDGSPMIWMEFYSPEREVYFIPDLSLVNNTQLRYGSDEYKEGLAERFFDGPARLELSYVPESDEFIARPWLSRACSEEAERHFVQSLRSGGGAQGSCIGALLDDAIVAFVLQNGLIERELSEVDAHRRLHAMGSGEIVAFSVETTGFRRYSVVYSFVEDESVIERLNCDIFLKEHPVWGLTLHRTDISAG